MKAPIFLAALLAACAPATEDRFTLDCALKPNSPPYETPRTWTINAARGKIFFTPDLKKPVLDDYCSSCEVSVTPEKVTVVDPQNLFKDNYRLDIDRLTGDAWEKSGDEVTGFDCRRIDVPNVPEPQPKI